MYSSVEQRVTPLEQMATIFRFCRNKLLIQWSIGNVTKHQKEEIFNIHKSTLAYFPHKDVLI